jgi:hypothetical protein
MKCERAISEVEVLRRTSQIGWRSVHTRVEKSNKKEWLALIVPKDSL